MFFAPRSKEAEEWKTGRTVGMINAVGLVDGARGEVRSKLEDFERWRAGVFPRNSGFLRDLERG